MERFRDDARVAAIVMALLTILYVVIRCTFLDRAVTSDERHWIGRSANFYRALRSGELQYTYQMAHPGVMTMWAGAIAYFVEFPDYFRQYTSDIKIPGYQIGTLLEQKGVQPLAMLNAARVSKIIMQAFFFLGCLEFLRRLFTLPVMMIAGILIVFDPFLSGLDTVLHVDGLFAITSACAMLAMCWAFEQGYGRRWPWISAGSLAACSWLTRTPGLLIPLLLAGILGVLVISRFIQRNRKTHAAPLRPPITAGLLWIGSWTITSLLLFPATWVVPGTVIDGIWAFSSNAATEGHGNKLFFNGKSHLGDPGALFYPVTLLWRLTPITQLGLILLAIFAFRAVRSVKPSLPSVQSLGILLLFAITYTVAMSFGAKKFDRYLLPVYPILDIVSACGYVLLVREMLEHRQAVRRYALPLVTTLVLLTQGLSTVSVFPYRLDYYNPLLGGARGAQDELQMGWGHGMNQVLAYVDMKTPAASRSTVISSSQAVVLNWLETDENSRLVLNPYEDVNDPRGWYETDYYALGIQEYQRNLSLIQGHLVSREPVFLAYVEGVEYFRVYRLNTFPYPDKLIKKTACTVDLVPGLQLLQVVERTYSFDFYFVATTDTPPKAAAFTVVVSGTNSDGATFSIPVTATLSPRANGMISKMTIANVAREAGVSSEVYTFGLSANDAETSTPYAVSKPGDLTSTETTSIQSGCYVPL